MKAKLQIEGLSCGHCVNAVNNLIKELNGVKNVEVSLPDSAEVDFDDQLLSLEDIKTTINNSEIYKVK